MRVVPGYHGEHGDGRRRRRRARASPPTSASAIFERFERGSAPSGEAASASGWRSGASCAAQMGGELRLDEDAERGARFVLELPIELPAGSHPEPEAEPTPYMS